MRALVVYSHPREGSFNAAVRDAVLARLGAAGAETRLLDLHAEGFDPRMTAERLADYEDTARNRRGLEAHLEALEWCDTLIFVYPTWWYGLPAMLKGWLDLAFLPGVAFHMPAGPGENIRPGLHNIRRLGVFTTCGASRWLTTMMGAPGRRTLLRGVRSVCAPRCRTAFRAHYLMDSSTPQSRARHLAAVSRAMDRLTGGAARPREAAA